MKLKKKDVNLVELEREILSPGDLYWKKENGAEVLISKKGEMLNNGLLKKLSLQNQKLFIENAIDNNFIVKFQILFKQYESCIQIKDKNQWRSEIINSLKDCFILSQENISQFDLDYLCHSLFSSISNREVEIKFFANDYAYALRAYHIASSYVIIAFLLGYYDHFYLRKIYTTTIQNFIELSKNREMISYKEKMDELKNKTTFSDEDLLYAKNEQFPTDQFKTILLEKFDGSGLFLIHAKEMTDLEIILLDLNSFFGFNSSFELNILGQIKKGNFNCKESILNLINESLDKHYEEVAIA